MPDPHLIPVHEHPEDVEPIVFRGLSVAIDPDLRRPHELALLSPLNRLDRPAEVVTPSSLHLDEGDGALLPNHEVDVAATIPEPTIHHEPPLSAEPALRDSLSQLPECLPGL